VVVLLAARGCRRQFPPAFFKTVLVEHRSRDMLSKDRGSLAQRAEQIARATNVAMRYKLD
jgi:hypothetical protein